MRNFLKQNSLLVLVCLALLYSFAATGTTITRPYSSSDYAGGTRAVGSKINSEFESIVSWLNGGNISSPNIAPSGVATSNLADESVTQAKLADKTVATGSLTITSTSTTVSTTASNNATLSGTLGRPVMVGLMASSLGGSIKVASDSVANPLATIEIWRDATMVSTQTFGTSKNAGEASYSVTIPATAVFHLDTSIATGTRNYFIKVKVNNASVVLTLDSFANVYAYEL